MPKKPAKRPARSKPAAARAKKAAPKKGAPTKAVPKKAAAPARAARPAAPPAPPPQSIFANLVFKESARAIDFYKHAFKAEEVMRMPSPDGKGIWHAELKIGASRFFLNDESPMAPIHAPSPEQGATASLNIYVPNCDSTFKTAVEAGAKVIMPLADMFWGDRFGMLTDPFGQVWGVSTHQKDLTAEEMQKAGEEFSRRMAQQQGQHGQQPAPGPAATQRPADA